MVEGTIKNFETSYEILETLKKILNLLKLLKLRAYKFFFLRCFEEVE